MGRYIVAVDIGGTFSDLVCLDTKTGNMSNVKVPSTPPTFVDGVMNAIKKVGIDPREMIVFKHGSTIATNAIIQRRGANTGLLTTRGFRDVLEAGRADRPDVFSLAWDPNPPLVLRRNRLVATEKMDYEGNEVIPLNEDEVREAARIFKRRGIEAVSICFINSFMNPAHEFRAKEILKEELPEAYICCSGDILREMKEFERMSTTTVNAYVGPILDKYLTNLTERMAQWGYLGDILIIHSGGGVVTCDTARMIPARTCQSGPAGGVVGGALIGKLAGFNNVITFDMGGTSTDIGLVHNGQPLLNPTGWKVEFRIPIRFPCIDVISIGAGGGSIAWIDPGGTLKNGPQSAGAFPGPACYDQGGMEPTNTDANLILGRLNPETFLGGEMVIKPELARRAVKKIADAYGMSVEEAAEGVIRIANANMVNGTRLISVERGYDPRDFAMVAFGGAGPLHAVDVSRQLNIPLVIVPQYPGIASAFGQLQVEMRHDYLRPILQREKEISAEQVKRIFVEMEEQAYADMAREGIPRGKVKLERFADVKYFPQSSYLTIPVKAGRLKEADITGIFKDFLTTHEKEFGYTVPPEYVDMEMVNARLTAIGPAPKGTLRRHPDGGRAKEALKGERKVYFREGGGFIPTKIYDRMRLRCGARLVGPAIVEQFDSTTVLPPGVTARVDEYLNIIIDLTRIL